MRRVVLQVTPSGAPHQYTDTFIDRLPGRFETVYYSARRVLFGRIDIVHLHWPEFLAILPGGPLTKCIGALVRLVLLARIRWGRVRVVRTLHNIEPHDEIESRWVRWYVARLDRLVDAWIVLNRVTASPDPVRTWLIPHTRYDATATPIPATGRLLCFGLVRRYKNVPGLIRVFRALDRPDLRLEIAGEPHPDELAEEVRAAAEGDARIDLDLAWVSAERLAERLREAELVVLPYTRMHNSGALLLALSNGRQVIAPDGPVVRELADEVGEAWIIAYTGAFDADVLDVAIRRARSVRAASGPDLSAREPARVAAAIAEVYDRVLDLS